MIRFSCPHCRGTLETPESNRGEEINCIGCGYLVQVPHPPDGYFRFPCPSCGKRLKAKPEHSGKKTHCANCGTHLVVPTPNARAASNPPPTMATSPDTLQFYFIQNGKRSGPATLQQMKERVASNQLGPEDMILRQGSSKWVAAHEIPELFPSIRPAPPPVRIISQRGAEVVAPPIFVQTQPASPPFWELSAC